MNVKNLLVSQHRAWQQRWRVRWIMLITMFAEKNPYKQINGVDLTLSSTNIVFVAIALSFCGTMIRHGINMPTALLGAFLVCAKLFQGRMERLTDESFLDLVKRAIDEMGNATPSSSSPPAAVAIAVAPHPDTPPDAASSSAVEGDEG